MREFFRRHRDAFTSVGGMQDTVAACIREQYALETVAVESLKPPRCLGLLLEDGRYFFKESEGDTSPAPLLAFAAQLREAGTPLPKIVPSVKGELHVPFCSGHAYLVEVVEGCLVDPTDLLHARASARALARFHQEGTAASMGRLSRNTTFGPNSVSAQHEEWFPEIRAIIAEGMPAFSRSQASTIRTAIETLATMPPALRERFPEVNIHGDYKPSHVFHVDGVITGIIDFEAAGHAHRLLDLVSATGAGLNHEGGRNPDLAAQAEFLRSYSDLMPLTPEEIAGLPFLLLWANTSRPGGLCSWRSRDVPVDESMYDSTVADIDSLLSAGEALSSKIGLN